MGDLVGVGSSRVLCACACACGPWLHGSSGIEGVCSKRERPFPFAKEVNAGFFEQSLFYLLLRDEVLQLG